MRNSELVPFPDIPKAEPGDRTFNLICPSESRVIGILKGRTGDYINASSLLAMVLFQEPTYKFSSEWNKGLGDGSRLTCPRCGSDLLLTYQDLDMEEALTKGVPLVLGAARIA